MSAASDYYQILGISSEASNAEIKQAYRQAAQLFHPDVNPSPGAGVLFQTINTAYDTLSDPSRRHQYDELLRKQARSISGPGLHVDVVYSRQYLRLMDEPQLLYTLLSMQPMMEMDNQSGSSTPLNLGIVVDRSTSMKGERLQQVKWACHRIIDNMSHDDIISVVSFSDSADVLIPAQRKRDPRNMKAAVSTLQASGATNILEGLQLGTQQLERNLDSRYVNHLILITDGRTFGDEEQCIALAANARERGIGISGMGIGEDWHDSFLDELATTTGGSSAYIATPETVSVFLQERIRSLATAYAERASMTIAPIPGINMMEITRITPEAVTVPIDLQPIPLGALDGSNPTNVLVQFEIQTGQYEPGPLLVGRVNVQGEILGASQRIEQTTKDLYIEVSHQETEEEPPPEILDALSSLMLIRLQSRAERAIEAGEIAEAKSTLEALSTRLFESGASDLAQAAKEEAQHIAATHAFSEIGAKQLKYGTRMLSTPFSGDSDD